jgi:carboxypeptidase Q
MKTKIMFLLVTAMATSSLSTSADSDLDMANKIRAEGFYNSHVMDTLSYLTNHIGPRLSGSPQMKQANDWTQKKLSEWGLKNAHQESYEFGRGWSHQSVSVDMISPRKVSLHAVPVAWTPGTNGKITGEAILFDAVTAEELKAYKGKISGKILLMTVPEELGEPTKKVFKRHESSDLSKIKEFNVGTKASHEPWSTPDRRDSSMQRHRFNIALRQFLKDENVAGVIYGSWRQGGLISIFGHSHKEDSQFPVSAVVVEAEQYNLLTRLIDAQQKIELSMNVDAQFHDDDINGYNTIAEIPGKNKNAEIVMLGGHLDSWHASDGAVDNGAGVAVAMEAVRILKALNVKPKRTIRIALWSGEEQGLYGSRAYVERHFASRPKPTNAEEAALPQWLWHSPGWPIKTKKAHSKLSAYFNMDNGSGRFRGIYTEGNVAVAPIFSSWFGPYSDLSAGTVTNKSTGGTDHEAFDDIGLPGFQFIQDPLDYGSRLHHTHIDSYEHVVEDDLKQASVIMAGFVYRAAMADAKLPRKPMPKEPSELIKKRKQLETDKKRRKRERDGNRKVDTKNYDKQ